MNIVIALALASLLGVSAGFSLGVIVVCRAFKLHGLRVIPPFDRSSTEEDHSDEDVIDQAAAEWARAHGQPAAAPLIARKLRLFQAATERRPRGWS